MAGPASGRQLSGAGLSRAGSSSSSRSTASPTHVGRPAASVPRAAVWSPATRASPAIEVTIRRLALARRATVVTTGPIRVARVDAGSPASAAREGADVSIQMALISPVALRWTPSWLGRGLSTRSSQARTAVTVSVRHQAARCSAVSSGPLPAPPWSTAEAASSAQMSLVARSASDVARADGRTVSTGTPECCHAVDVSRLFTSPPRSGRTGGAGVRCRGGGGV